MCLLRRMPLKLLIEAAAGKCSLVTNALVVAEIVWTLESYYRLSKSNIRSKVLAILNTPGLEIAESDLLLQAALWYAEKNVDFIDAYNAAWMVSHDISAVSTFDKKHYARLDGDMIRIPAQLRSEYRIRPPDALQAAACLQHGAQAFITNDEQMKRLQDKIAVLVLEDYVARL